MRKYLFLLALLVGSASCWAHGTADNHLQVMIVDDRVKLNITVDMRVLQRIDEDNDGYASLAELTEHRGGFQEWIRDTLKIVDEGGNAGTVVFSDVTSDLNIAHARGDRVDHARILQTLLFDDVPEELRVNVAVLAMLVPELRVTVIDASTDLTYELRDPSRPQTVVMPAR